MPIEVVLPKVDMDMESGVIAEWKVAEGDLVRAGEVLFDMETAKSIMEVEAPGTGRIRGLASVDGQPIAVGTPVAWIDVDTEPMQADPTAHAPSAHAATATGASARSGNGATGDASTGTGTAGGAAARDAATRPASRGPAPALGGGHAPAGTADAPRPLDDFVADLVGGELRATPLARALGREHGVDLRALHGSGPRGRVQATDVEDALKARAVAPARPDAGADATLATAATRVPFSPTRRVIAERLAHSMQAAPHFYLTAHVEMTALRAALEAAAPAIVEATGTRPGVTVALAWLVARVLVRHPRLNASADADATLLHRHVHVGIAIDRDGELAVPVLRDADTRTLAELTRDFAALRAAVHDRTIQPAAMRDGTFTISNLGMHGVDAFTAIINPPQSAILAVGRTVDTPVGRDGAIVLRPMATLSLSSDHRIVDGVTAARFMADLRRAIEAPDALA